MIDFVMNQLTIKTIKIQAPAASIIYNDGYSHVVFCLVETRKGLEKLTMVEI